MANLSNDQKKALNSLGSWFKNRHKSQSITLGGYAGTGKTTLISILRQKLHRQNKKLKVAFVTYTGKAARVLKSKLKESNSTYRKDSIGTIHSLIYSPIINEKQQIIGWQLKDKIKCDLIIIDEASMVNREIWQDLCSYKIRVIAVGDHDQLPPIKGSFNLMEKPNIRLEKIHRQARLNPIIKLSILARSRGVIPLGNYAARIKKIASKNPESQDEIEMLLQNYNKDTLILCGYNSTRIKLNNFIRSALGFQTPQPQSSDRVICLRNNHEKAIANGMLGTISSIKTKNKKWFEAEIKMDGEHCPFSGLISKTQFNNHTPLNFTRKRGKFIKGDLFDFGYAITVHKAQGSEAKRVILFEERFKKSSDEMWRRWLYTAVTRAQEELFIIGST